VERVRAQGRGTNVELSERDKDMDKHERIKIQQGVCEVYDLGRKEK
jgi:hypothetical protein